LGTCATDKPDDCAKRAIFSKFSVESIPGSTCAVQLTNQQPAEAATSTATKTTTTALMVDKTGNSGFKLPIEVVGPLGFLAGALCAVLVLTAVGCFQKQGMQRVPEAPTQRTFQQSQVNSNSLVSLASIAEMQEAEQQA